MELNFVTSSKDKFQEANTLIPNLKMMEIELDEIQDIDAKKVIQHKLEQAKKITDKNIAVEDISFCITELNGFPGPLIKWMAKSIGVEGIYNLSKNFKDKSAKVICNIGCLINGEMKFFSAEVQGTICSPRGSNGWGFDVIFIPDGQNLSLAEMNPEQRSEVSHRTLAWKMVKEYLNL